MKSIVQEHHEEMWAIFQVLKQARRVAGNHGTNADDITALVAAVAELDEIRASQEERG